MSELYKIEIEAALHPHVLDVLSDNRPMCSHEVALMVLPENLRYSPDVVLDNAMDAGHVVGSILTSARVNSITGRTVFCF